MKLDGASGHLTYCSNIHPGETWAEVRANLGRYVPSVRDQVARGRPFGIGLRLSAEAAQTLAQPEAMAELKAFLARENLYIFTLNGFPYGTFHGKREGPSCQRPKTGGRWRFQAAPERLCKERLARP